MSGGFFRGTSADQDTRFSDKQAKLLKSQKFAPELDHLVDMTKVKMDVIRPWIATRTTELLGFEDEVLIYFVYGLLEQKVVDGKKIQIQLTGFMEKNTGKFMRELWSLLLSAQLNASGVPQQFLDAKEEEMQRKKAETDRITLEIQKRKDRDGREREREKHNRMDVEGDTSRFSNAIPDPVEKHASPRASSIHPAEVKEVDKWPDHSTKKRSSSPQENDHSKSPVSRVHSPARSSSKSFSRSRSYSREGRKSRSLSISSQSPRRSRPFGRRNRFSKRQSVSPDMRCRSPRRRSISPRHRSPPHKTRSPARRRSPYIRRRSNSRSRYRSPSPIRRRSPYAQRRSPPPLRHRSPIRGRSITPPRHRGQSPSTRRSPPRRSPNLRRSSPAMRRRGHSPSTRRSPPRRSPNLRRSSPAMRHRSQTPIKRRSPQRRSFIKRLSPQRRSPIKRLSPQRRSPIRRLSPSGHRSPSSSRKLSPHRSPKYQRSPPLRSPRQHESEPQILVHQRNRSYSPYGSQSPPQRTHRSSSEDRSCRANGINSTRSHHGSAFARLRETRPPIHSAREKDASKPSDQRSRSLSGSPINKREEKKPRHESPEASGEEDHSDFFREDSHRESYTRNKKAKPLVVEVAHGKVPGDAACSADKLAASQSPSTSEKKGLERRTDGFTEMNRRDVSPSSEDKEYGPGKVGKERCSSYSKSNARSNRNYQVDMTDRASKEVDTRHHNLEKRRHRKSHDRKGDISDGSESDSELDDRKEAKRRKKDEKRQRKEERRRRREERHQRKLERRAAKLKAKPRDTVTPSDFEKDHDVTCKAAENAPTCADFHSGEEGSDSDQRRLEIELRKKALESLRAKKATTH